MAIAITTATHGAHRGLPASARTLVAGMVAVLVAIAPEQVAAASNALSAGKAMPASGTTQTSFTLSVGYLSPHGAPATRVVALAANRTIEMALFSGRSDDGVWEAIRPAAGRHVAGDIPGNSGAGQESDAGGTNAGGDGRAQSDDAADARAAPRGGSATADPARAGSTGTTCRAGGARRTPGGATRHRSFGGRSHERCPASGWSGRGAAERRRERVARASWPARRTVICCRPRVPMDSRERRRCHSCSSPSPDSPQWSEHGVCSPSHADAVVARRPPSCAPAAPAARAAGPTVRPARRRPADWELASLDDEPIGTVDYLGLRP